MAETIFSIERGPEDELTLRIKPKTLRLISPPVKGHLMAVRKELLLAIRSVLDEAISAVDREEKPKKKTKIDIE